MRDDGEDDCIREDPNPATAAAVGLSGSEERESSGACLQDQGWAAAWAAWEGE